MRPWLLLLAACGSDPEPTRWTASVTVHLDEGAVIDPKLGGGPELPVRVEVDAPKGCALTVLAEDLRGRTAVLHEGEAAAELAWDGRDEAAVPFDPGAVQLRGELDCGTGELAVGTTTAHVVRLGVVAVDLDGDEVDGQVPLAYHKLDLFERGITLLDGVAEWVNDRERAAELGDLDGDDGLPREAPEPWADPDAPPWEADEPGAAGLGRQNVPAGYVAGSTPVLTATFGATAVSAHRGVPVAADGEADPPAIRVVPDELEPTGDAAWSAGGNLRFTMTEALPTTMGRVERTITWRYEAEAEDGAWTPIPGHQETTHAFWVLAGQPMVPDGTAIEASPAVAWIGALEDVNPSVAGIEASDHFALMDALRDLLHEDPYLVYNPNDSAYTAFSGPYMYWDSIWVELGEWLDREGGVELYCHSVACVLSSLANHLGLPAEYVTIGVGFTTHLTRSAGGTSWRRWSFNSHGIATVDGGAHVWDAAVDIDGDEDPDNEPVSPVAPKGMPFEDYLELLTAGDIGQINGGRCYVY